MKLKTILIGSAAASAMAFAAPAGAETYLSVFGGWNSLDGDDLGFGPFSYTGLFSSDTDATTIYFVGAIFGTSSWTGYFSVTSSGTLKTTRYTNAYGSTYAAGFSEDEFDSGFVVGGAFGFDFANGLRSEIEIAWRKNDMGEDHAITGTQNQRSYAKRTDSWVGYIKRFTTGGSFVSGGSYTTGNPFIAVSTSHTSASTPLAVTATASGDVSSFALMANVWYDFDLGESSPIIPFVGVGLGAVNLSVDYSGAAALPPNAGSVIGASGTIQNTIAFATDTEEWTWGWQVGAGLAYEFGDGMRLSAQYRYFSTGDITVAGQDFGVNSQEGLIGLHIPFGR